MTNDEIKHRHEIAYAELEKNNEQAMSEHEQTGPAIGADIPSSTSANRQYGINQCHHGQLARVCYICELEKERDSLMEKLAEVEDRAVIAETNALNDEIVLKARLAEAEKDAGHWKRMYECAQNANAFRQSAIDAELAKERGNGGN
jgi:hypothetical protein